MTATPAANSNARPDLEVYFDCSSPWTYLGFESIQPIAAEAGVEIVWKPILVGGIFNSVNPSVYQSRETPVPAKAAYMKKDLQDWARFAGLKIVFPPKVFPVNSVKAMRGCIHAGRQGRLVPFARAVFQAYWSEDRDISRDDVLAEVSTAGGLDPVEMAAAMAESGIKAELKANTDEAIARGAFGSPTFFVGGTDMYFGNDRMPLVRAALARLKERA